MASQAILDQIHEFESFMSIWETQSLSSPEKEPDCMFEKDVQAACNLIMTNSDQRREGRATKTEPIQLLQEGTQETIRENDLPKSKLYDLLKKRSSLFLKETTVNLMPNSEKLFEKHEAILSQKENDVAFEDKIVQMSMVPEKDTMSAKKIIPKEALLVTKAESTQNLKNDRDTKGLTSACAKIDSAFATDKNYVDNDARITFHSIKDMLTQPSVHSISEKNQKENNDNLKNKQAPFKKEEKSNGFFLNKSHVISKEDALLMKETKTENNDIEMKLEKPLKTDLSEDKKVKLRDLKKPFERQSNPKYLLTLKSLYNREAASLDTVISSHWSEKTPTNTEQDIDSYQTKTGNTTEGKTLQANRSSDNEINNDKSFVVDCLTIPENYPYKALATSKKVKRKSISDRYNLGGTKKELPKAESSISLLSLATKQPTNCIKIRQPASFQKIASSPSLRGMLMKKGGDERNMLPRTLSIASFVSDNTTHSYMGSSLLTRKSLASSKSSLRVDCPFEKQSRKPSKKYISRSYEEMMRIPNVLERISFYEKTLKLCLNETSPITDWSNKMIVKGKPEALEEGYIPIYRSDSLSDYSSCNSPGMSFSESISQFWKKASGSQASSIWSSTTDSKLSTSLSRNSNRYRGGFLERSMSRLGLSYNSKIESLDKSKSFSTRINAVSRMPSFSRSSSIRVISSSFITSKSAQPTGQDPLKNLSKEKLSELNYMATILPHEDIRVLLDALNEANGDTMNAISIALNKIRTLEK
ncbi:hypothetical protein BY458DRAFT_569626 [Sporodiniella umbellata]|nr:hypothetical protein BY458DRAFT_569626 [Sporodiniella umbellata]